MIASLPRRAMNGTVDSTPAYLGALVTHYKFLIGFICGLLIGLIPPLILLRSDSAAIDRMTSRFVSNSDQDPPLVLPAPAARTAAARVIVAHDITGIEAAWKTITPPAGGTVVFVGPSKGLQVPGVTVADDRVVVLFQATTADQEALATALAAAAKP